MAAANEYEDCTAWILKQKEILESVKYGKNQYAINESISELLTRSAIITDYEKEVESASNKVCTEESRDQLESSYENLKGLCSKKLSHLNTLLEVVSLEDATGHLSGGFDLLATDLVKPELRSKVIGQQTGGHIPGFVSPLAQESIFATRDTWKWMQDVVKCLGIHLKNAAQYHQFFQTSDELEDHITKDIDHLKNIYSEEEFKGDYADAKRLLQEIDELIKTLRQWETKTAHQWEQATKVIPVHIRAEGVNEPTPIRALCDYETKEITVREGEDLVLMDNVERNSWKVRDCRGQELDIPAVVCLIPGPFTEAIEAAVRLRLKLVSLWTESLKMIGSRFITFMLTVFKDSYPEDERDIIQSIPEDERNELLRIMTYIDDTLRVHWLDEENFQCLQMRLLGLRNILDEVKDQPGNGTPGNSALVVQMSMIENLMDKYKTLEHERYTALIQLILHETKLQKGNPVRQELWKDWLTYKSVLETVSPTDLILMVGKWEELSTRSKSSLDGNLRTKAEREEMERKEREERERKERERREREEKLKRENEEKERKAREDKERREKEDRERKEREEWERKEREERERKEREDRERKEREGRERKEREDRERKEREDRERKEREDRGRKEREDKERKEREDRERKEREDKERKEREDRERIEREEMERKQRLKLEQEERERREREIRLKKEQEEREKRESEERERKEREMRLKKEQEDRERREREERERREREERERKLREEEERKQNPRHIAETSEMAASEMEEEKTFGIESVYDPRSGKKISLKDAIQQGIIIPRNALYINPKTGEELFIPTAMDRGLIEVSHTKVRRGVEKKSTIGLITIIDSNKKEASVTYAVKSVMDARTKRHLTFQEAVHRGILTKGKEVGYRNTATEQTMDVGRAIHRGFIDAQAISDARSFDIDPENQIIAREEVPKEISRSFSLVPGDLKKAISMETLGRSFAISDSDDTHY